MSNNNKVWELLEVLADIRKLHDPVLRDGKEVCFECSCFDGVCELASYPCDTVKRVDKALGGEQ